MKNASTVIAFVGTKFELLNNNFPLTVVNRIKFGCSDNLSTTRHKCLQPSIHIVQFLFYQRCKIGNSFITYGGIV